LPGRTKTRAERWTRPRPATCWGPVRTGVSSFTAHPSCLALDCLAKAASPDTPLPTARGAGLTLGEWRTAGPALRREVQAELAAALFFVLDSDGSRSVSLDEWRAFDWPRLLPLLEQHIRGQVAQSRKTSAPVICAPESAAARVAAPSSASAASFSPHVVAEVRLEGRGLEKVPSDALSSATRRLHVENNRLRSLPELPEDLRELHAQHNQLAQLPERFPRNLLRLRLDSNQLSEVPAGLHQLPELALLWLAGNPELPEAWQQNVPAEADHLDRAAVVAFLAERKKEAEEEQADDDDSSGSLSAGEEMEKKNVALDDHTQTMGLLGLMLSPEHRDSLTPKVTRK
jgi:hypothetical protein